MTQQAALVEVTVITGAAGARVVGADDRHLGVAGGATGGLPASRIIR
ncbi:MAG: hypothetical protein NZ699_01705 [Roseiflexus sp.]|nr:hypothetical protein [Roseiflexus sp.]MCS7287826.1 hypothetical protein [Roseiflexus sp.]MDW8146587.1 hypothetical protein [Roseiflexaceae bacterium]